VGRKRAGSSAGGNSHESLRAGEGGLLFAAGWNSLACTLLRGSFAERRGEEEEEEERENFETRDAGDEEGDPELAERGLPLTENLRGTFAAPFTTTKFDASRSSTTPSTVRRLRALR
jgi:hypothetical protein